MVITLKRSPGFTIVELLIVIVVIAILAAITIVAYNGIQERARYSSMQSDIKNIDTAIKMYHADNGHYPHNGVGAGSTTNTNIGAMLGSNYLPRTPLPNAPNSYYAYIWTTGGTEYKVVRLVNLAEQFPEIEKSHPSLDTRRPGRGWGVWSAGGVNL
ncbi:prepilin-type N-terminal cleavage/methylation domain-containing protein [Candidatus Saccharibacteria bacterium]|nr:prepilin-type N-terminal cleavage/methylation domain-containing protein [Candidatus Saccharibacteria bacterium]